MNNDSNNNEVDSTYKSIDNQESNIQDKEDNVSTESLTVDYNNLYKLNTNDTSPEKQSIDQNDIQFDSADYVQDEDLVRSREKVETKHNLIFMALVLIILVITILVIFPIVFKLKI